VRLSDLLFLVLAVVLAASLASIRFYPSRQEFMSANTAWDGIKGYAQYSGASHIDNLEDLPSDPEHSVLLAIPYLEYQPYQLDMIKQFVSDGGTLIVMDDFGSGNQLLEFLDIEIRFDHRLLLDPLFCYKNPNLPLVTDFSNGIKEAGIKSLLFNHASALNKVAKVDALAWSSNASFLDTDKNGAFDLNEPQGPLVVAAVKKANKGLVTMVADTGLILNSMLDKNDNHNFMKYLTGQKGWPDKLLIDRAHLAKSTLDESKIKTSIARDLMSNPYLLLGIVAVIFAIIAGYVLKRGVNR
jgi:hypothetical protein